jgi:RNA polymerase sigma-70 factor (ECF subfamily)
VTDEHIADVYQRYGHLVLRRCLWILGDPAAADDALQEVFVRLWRYGDAFAQAEAKVPWLNRVAERCCFDVLARRRRRAEAPLDEAAELVEPFQEADRRLEDRDLVHKVLDRFDDQSKQIALLYYLDELSYEEIGTVTGLSRQTVSKKLALLRARAQRLRPSIAGEQRAS